MLGICRILAMLNTKKSRRLQLSSIKKKLFLACFEKQERLRRMKSPQKGICLHINKLGGVDEVLILLSPASEAHLHSLTMLEKPCGAYT